jgi:beta-glucosidase/6-phospho-beta-glucosidase/beta-galactosidase
LKFLSGFESTHIFGSGKDVLELTRHNERFEEDLRLAHECGLDLMRYSAPWHRIERVPGVYDWSWLDRALGCMRELGIRPIIDPLHHTSFPEWLEGGFANQNFPRLYLKFCTALAERYPWIEHWTVVNEPFVTTWFCGHEGTWYPFRQGAENFVPMLMNVCEAISRVSRMLVETLPEVCLVHVDAAEKHRAVDAVSEPHTEFHNEIRFIVPDLVLGLVDERHRLYDYLRRWGAGEERLAEFRANPARIDVMGLDYYSHCELEWCESGRIYPNKNPEGLVPTALEYAERYRLPLMLSETNIRGFVEDRITWLKFMVEQCEQIEEAIRPLGLSFEGFCWYPFIDSTDWCSLVTEANGNIDPQGIYYLDCQHNRVASELSDIFARLVRGEINSGDIPAYRFQSPLDELLENFLPMMNHWQWSESNLHNAKFKTKIQLIRAENFRRKSHRLQPKNRRIHKVKHNEEKVRVAN